MLILLDRDGVINVDLPTGVRSLKEFQLIAGSASAIARVNAAHLPVAIVTNQALVGRGEISLNQLHDIHNTMQDLLFKENAHIDHIFYCTDTTIEPHNRRKPASGMLLEAMNYFNAKPEDTIMIGDALSDMQAATAAGCKFILLKTGKGLLTLQQNLIDLQTIDIFDNLYDAVQDILFRKE